MLVWDAWVPFWAGICGLYLLTEVNPLDKPIGLLLVSHLLLLKWKSLGLPREAVK